MEPEVTQSEDDKLWAQVQQDRASTLAEDPITPEPSATDADPLAALPEPTRKLIEGLNTKIAEQDARLHTVGQQLATAHGTMGSMKQQLDESRVTLQRIAPTLDAVEATKKAADASVADEAKRKREEVRERLKDLPDILEYLDMVVPADVKPVEAEAKPEVEKKEEVNEAADPDLVRILTLQRELSDVAPGWMKKRDSAEFKAWLPLQSAELQANGNSWDVEKAASVFAAFDTHTSDAAKVAKVEAGRQERLRRGESVTGRGTSNGNVETSDDALWKKVSQDRARARAA